VGRTDRDWGKEARERRGSADDSGDAGHLTGDPFEFRCARVGALLDEESIAVERGEATVADVGGEDVQTRPLGELVETAIAVEKLLVVAFQHSIGGQTSTPPGNPVGKEAEAGEQRGTPGDVGSHVEPD